MCAQSDLPQAVQKGKPAQRPYRRRVTVGIIRPLSQLRRGKRTVAKKPARCQSLGNIIGYMIIMEPYLDPPKTRSRKSAFRLPLLLGLTVLLYVLILLPLQNRTGQETAIQTAPLAETVTR